MYGGIGFDIDGTLTANWAIGKYADIAIKMKSLAKDPGLVKEMQALLYSQVPIMLPLMPAHIITNRPVIYFRKATTDWLDLFDVEVIQLHMAIGVCIGEERILRKAYVINELGLEIYFEDEEEIRGRLFYLCPDTRILAPGEALRMGLAKKIYTQ